MDSTKLWQRILHETTLASQQEPVLASFFYVSILSHNNLSSALSHNLAQELGNTVVSALALRQLFDNQMAKHPEIIASVTKDILACFERDPACDQYAMPLLYFKGFRALQAYRLYHSLWLENSPGIALYLQGRVSELFDVDIHPAARIGAGVMLDHATGLVIGETTVVDDDVSILHSVTLGGTGNETGDRHPKIRQGVLIATGAKILGNIEIGQCAKIAAGSLVLENVPEHTTVAGVPARAVGKLTTGSPALDMEQYFNNGAI